MASYFKNIKKDMITTEEDRENFVINNICRFCENEIISDKVRDLCQLTGKYRRPAHNTCKKKTLNRKIVILHRLLFIILVNTSVICSLKK